MAAANTLQSLQEEATCSICLDHFTEPVTLQCGHNFCQACVSQCWEESEANVSCPRCGETVQERNLRLNRQLANIVEIAKRLRAQPAAGERMCGEHQEDLKLFCKEDQTLICTVCHLFWAHQAHIVVPIEEAAEEYKEKVQAHLKTLRDEREKLLGFKVNGEGKSREYLEKTEKEKEKIVSEFQQLEQFLKEQQQYLLVQLEKLEKEIVKTQNENITKRFGEIARVSELISELEGKCQKPANEFLKDIRNILIRCESGKLQQPEQIFPELEKGLSNVSQRIVASMETLETFKDTLLSTVGFLESFTQENVTLDPDTAHPHLVLSKDGKRVGWGRTEETPPNDPERFDTAPCVLGCEGFISGRHCWEVAVWSGCCSFGVARESMRRKGRIYPSPEEGIWALKRRVNDEFEALTCPVTPLSLSRVPKKVWVCLDCDQGQVMFFNAADKSPIFTFPPGSVRGWRIRPWFQLAWRDSQIRLSSQDGQA